MQTLVMILDQPKRMAESFSSESRLFKLLMSSCYALFGVKGKLADDAKPPLGVVQERSPYSFRTSFSVALML